MNTQQMKEEALQIALASPDKNGSVEVINFNRTWKMTCHCHNLTSFGFYLFMQRGAADNFHPHCDIGEKEARVFLYALGHTA